MLVRINALSIGCFAGMVGELVSLCNGIAKVQVWGTQPVETATVSPRDLLAVWEVLYWGSHPDAGNDDCIMGLDCGSLDMARKQFAHQPDSPYVDSSAIAYIEVKGAGIHETRKNPDYVVPTDDDDTDDWTREYARQQGMAFGCQGFNDAMGY